MSAEPSLRHPRRSEGLPSGSPGESRVDPRASPNEAGIQRKNRRRRHIDRALAARMTDEEGIRCAPHGPALHGFAGRHASARRQESCKTRLKTHRHPMGSIRSLLVAGAEPVNELRVSAAASRRRNSQFVFGLCPRHQKAILVLDPRLVRACPRVHPAFAGRTRGQALTSARMTEARFRHHPEGTSVARKQRGLSVARPTRAVSARKLALDQISGAAAA